MKTLLGDFDFTFNGRMKLKLIKPFHGDGAL